MTEETHEKLAETLGDQFCKELAESAAKVLAQLPEEDFDEALYYLQDKTSLFQPGTFDRLKRKTMILRKIAENNKDRF